MTGVEQTITAKFGLRLVVSGSLVVSDGVVLTGRFEMGISIFELSIGVDATIDIFGAKLAVRGFISVYSSLNFGIAAILEVSSDPELLNSATFKLNGSFSLRINTTSISRTLGTENSVELDSFTIEMTGSGTLEFLSSVSITGTAGFKFGFGSIEMSLDGIMSVGPLENMGVVGLLIINKDGLVGILNASISENLKIFPG